MDPGQVEKSEQQQTRPQRHREIPSDTEKNNAIISGSQVIQVVSIGGKGRNQENGLISGIPKELQNTSLTDKNSFVETTEDLRAGGTGTRKRMASNNRKVQVLNSVSSRRHTNQNKKERNVSIASIADEIYSAEIASSSNGRQNTVQDSMEMSQVMSPLLPSHKLQQPRIGNSQVAINSISANGVLARKVGKPGLKQHQNLTYQLGREDSSNISRGKRSTSRDENGTYQLNQAAVQQYLQAQYNQSESSEQYLSTNLIQRSALSPVVGRKSSESSLYRKGYKANKSKIKTELMRNHQQSEIIIETEDQQSPKKEGGKREADERSSSRVNDSSHSTSVGSTDRSRKQAIAMLPRDHTMTKEQLLLKVHKEMYCCLEFMGGNHDKLGNGFAAFAYIFKKTGAVTLERIRKALFKRATQKYSRKLFSIYRYRVGNVRRQKRLVDTQAILITEEEESFEKEQDGAGKLALPQTSFSSCIHYYKRDLSPVRESYPQCNMRTPYRQNFSNYQVNMMSKDFKDSLLKSMGGSVKCVQSTDQNRKISTYYNTQEVCTQKHLTAGTLNLDQFLPTKAKSGSGIKADDKSGKNQKFKPTVSAYLRKTQVNDYIAFDKLPKRGSLNFLSPSEPLVQAKRSSLASNKLEEVSNAIEEENRRDDQEKLEPEEVETTETHPDEQEKSLDQSKEGQPLSQVLKTQQEEPTSYQELNPPSPSKLKAGSRLRAPAKQPVQNYKETGNYTGPRTQSKKIALLNQQPQPNALTQKLNIKISGVNKLGERGTTNRVQRVNRTNANIGIVKGVKKGGANSTNVTKPLTVIAAKDVSRNLTTTRQTGPQEHDASQRGDASERQDDSYFLLMGARQNQNKDEDQSPYVNIDKNDEASSGSRMVRKSFQQRSSRDEVKDKIPYYTATQQTEPDELPTFFTTTQHMKDSILNSAKRNYMQSQKSESGAAKSNRQGISSANHSQRGSNNRLKMSQNLSSRSSLLDDSRSRSDKEKQSNTSSRMNSSRFQSRKQTNKCRAKGTVVAQASGIMTSSIQSNGSKGGLFTSTLRSEGIIVAAPVHKYEFKKRQISLGSDDEYTVQLSKLCSSHPPKSNFKETESNQRIAA